MQVKLIFTVLIVVTGIFIWFIDSSNNNTGSDDAWCMGSSDPFRRLLFKPNGAFRKYTKLGLFIWLIFFLVLIWFIVPIK